MRTTVLTWLLLIALAVALPAAAVQVDGLYTSEVPVASQQADERARATSEALRQVLLKITGLNQLPDDTELAAQLDNPDRFLQGVAYAHRPPLSEQESRRQYLQASFSVASVDRLIRDSGLPVWPANRPQMMVWMVTDDSEQGRRHLLPEQYPAQQRLLREAAAKVGLPIAVPTYDLEDTLTLSADQLWDGERDAIEQATERYGADGWLMVRYFRSGGEVLRGGWSYQIDGETRSDTFQADDFNAVMEIVMSAVAANISRRTAYVPQVGVDRFTLVVSGINSYSRYKAALAEIEAQEVVISLQLQQVSGDTLYLSVATEGDLDILADALQSRGRLSLVQPLPDDPQMPLQSLELIWVN